MAGRVSTALGADRAAKLYTNTTGGAVVATVHMTSSDNTKNPICSFSIDSVSNRSLNTISVQHTLANNLSSGYGVEGDLKSSPKGSNIIGSVTVDSSTRMKLNGVAGSYSAGSYSAHHMYIDPYFFTNPDAYGKEKATHGIRSNNKFYLKENIAADKSHMRKYLDYTDIPNTGTNTNNQTFDYYAAGGIICSYTDVFINFETNAYMSGGHFYTTTGNQSTNSTSDSAYYQFSGSSYNPNSYKRNTPFRVDMASDAGLFIYCMHPNATATQSAKIGFMSANRFRNGSTDWDGTTFNNYTHASAGSSFVGYSQAWQAAVDVSGDGGYLVSWMKYNLVTKKFYLNMQGSGNNKGVYSFDHNSIFPASNNSGGNLHSDHTTVFTLEGATHPLTAETTEPMRLGAAFWQVYKLDGSALYSTDLINWKTAVEITEQSNATGVYRDTKTGANLFTDSTKNPNQLMGAKTGYSDVDQAGTIENSTGIGNYERNGIILNSGDSIYAENKDSSTSVNATVMFVEV